MKTQRPRKGTAAYSFQQMLKTHPPIDMLAEQRDTAKLGKAINNVWANRLSKALRERDQYKARAERLAEALKDLRSRVVAEKVDCLNTTNADAALAEWEGAQK